MIRLWSPSLVASLVVWSGFCAPAAAQVVGPVAPPRQAEGFAAWVTAAGDNRGLPFAIIDKASADVVVFDANGRLQGSGPALLGVARGDDVAAGIGDRRLSTINPDERATQAGRFFARFGTSAEIPDVLWIDYKTSLSLHPVITTNPAEQRLRRLESPSAEDNRITFGCINVSAAFYADVVRRVFGGASGIIYILPETRRLEEVFPTFAAQPPNL